ncbi:MAG: cytochrome P450 [Thermoleophilaceae bacterium]
MARAPGPRLPAIAQAALVTAEPYRWMAARQRRHGDVFSSRFPMFGDVTYVASPDTVRAVFGAGPDTHRAGEANSSVLGPVLGANSLLTLDGGEHLRQRKLLLPPFHGERITGYAELIADITEAEVSRWPLGVPFALRPAMQRITLEVILRAVFGVRGEERLERFREALPKLGETSNFLLFFEWLRRDLGPLSPWAHFLRVRAAVDELIYEEIALHRDAPDLDERDDVLSLLLRARDEDGQPMTDEELRDELMTLLTAGHETTATGLSWAFERLVRTPAVLATAVDTLDEGDEYLDAVVRETLRLRPVIVDVGRRLTGDWQLHGYDLPAGTLVLPAIAAIHRRADLWERPLLFRPERFIESQPVPYSWIPFGGGVRRCIGAAFAQMEMRVVLRGVLERVSLAYVREAPERPRVRHVTAVPGRDAEVVVSHLLPTRVASSSEGARVASPA